MDIIEASETWAENEIILPREWQTFHITSAKAIRDKSTGRTSGGLVSLHKSNLHCTEVESSDSWIFNSYSSAAGDIIIGSVYFRPSRDMETMLDLLQLTLNELNAKFVDCPKIIGGDFNARVSNLNDIDPNLLHGTNLKPLRLNQDKIKDGRGSLLEIFMQQNGYILLNGRTPGDRVGNFTFSNRRGTSTIDLIWIDFSHAEILEDMSVSQTSSLSDHFPILVKLNIDILKSKTAQSRAPDKISKFSWDQSKLLEFHNLLCDPVNLPNDNTFNSLSIDKQNATIIDEIKAVYRSLEMEKTVSFNPKKTNKPWFDTNCKTAKIELNLALRTCKQNNFDATTRNNYADCKRNYKNLLKQTRKEYINEIKNKFANTKNSKEFWKVYKSYNKQSTLSNPIPIDQWTEFFQQVYHTRILN